MSKYAFPLPVHSFWGQLSIYFLGICWVIFLLLGLYKIFRSHLFILRASFSFASLTTQRHLLDENIPDYSFELASRGLASELLLSLPLVKFKKEMKEDDGACSDSECAICLVEFGDGDWQRVLPNCLHMFHVHCIDTWLRSRSDCPLCRKKVVCDYSDLSSITVVASLETLRREDFCRTRPLGYHVLESDRVALHLPFTMIGI